MPTGWLKTTVFMPSYCLNKETTKSNGVNPISDAEAGAFVLKDNFLVTKPGFSKEST